MSECLDGFGMPAEWTLSIEIPIFKGIGDVRNCSCSRAVRLFEHGMKVVEKEEGRKEMKKRSEERKWLHRIVTIDEMQ